MLGQNSDFYLFAIKTHGKTLKVQLFFFFEYVPMDDFSSKREKNKGDRDLNRRDLMLILSGQTMKKI